MDKQFIDKHSPFQELTLEEENFMILLITPLIGIFILFSSLTYIFIFPLFI